MASNSNATGFANIIHSNFNSNCLENKIGEIKNKNCIKLLIIIWTSLNLVQINDKEIHMGNKKIKARIKENIETNRCK